jgi:hypothetical protein
MEAETRLRARQSQRLADIVTGRGGGRSDGRTEHAHYLIVERSPLAVGADRREIEQYRDLERLVATAADCASGDRHATCVGAFTATYRDGVLLALALITDLKARVEAHRAGNRPLSPLPSRRNFLQETP